MDAFEIHDNRNAGSMIGREIAGFRINAEIGSGNNGAVYLARQLMMDRNVALKILLPDLANDREYITQLLKEARYAARLSHPNIVQALDAGITPEGICFFAMEFVNGKSLEEIRLTEPERLTPAFLRRIAVELASAMDYAWRSTGMTHGDIKPGNLLIRDDNGMTKLTDFGLARISGAQSSGALMATPLYAAPEVISNSSRIDVRGDLYSFGVMFYELLSGAPPFSGSTEKVLEQHLHASPPPLEEKRPDLDAELIGFIHQLLEKDPELRPAGWAEVRRFFAARLEAGDAVVEPVVMSAADITPPRSGRRRITMAASAVAAVLLLLSMAVWGVAEHRRRVEEVRHQSELLAPPPSEFKPEEIIPPPENKPSEVVLPVIRVKTEPVQAPSPPLRPEPEPEPEPEPKPEPEPESKAKTELKFTPNPTPSKPAAIVAQKSVRPVKRTSVNPASRPADKKVWPPKVESRIAPAEESLKNIERFLRNRRYAGMADRLHDSVAEAMAILLELEKATMITMPPLAKVEISRSGAKSDWDIRGGRLYIRLSGSANVPDEIADMMFAAYGSRLDRARLLASELIPDFRRFVLDEMRTRSRKKGSGVVTSGYNCFSVLCNGSFEQFKKQLQSRKFAEMRSVRRQLRRLSSSRR